jgi:uncharacterized protein YqgC (DUF456 family)
VKSMSLRWGFRRRFGWGGANVRVVVGAFVGELVGADLGVFVGAFICVLVGEERT